MKKYQSQQIRNVVLVGHGGSGKTSVAEAILFNSGASDRLGKVGDNSSVMDYDPDEIKRGHSVNASIAFCEFNKHKVNLLDSPGSNNFIADTPGCIRVSDGAVVVISGEDGVQFYTEKVWKWTEELALQRIIFINKMDSDKSSTKSILDTIKKKFDVLPLMVHAPVGVGADFKGVVDLVHNKFHSYKNDGSGKGETSDPPDDLKDTIEMSRAELVETVAESDDELLEKYLESGEISDDDFTAGLKKGIQSGQLIPVFCGSATQNMGIDLLMEAIVDFLPSPDQRPAVKGKSVKDGSDVELKADDQGPFASLVFKTIADPYAGKLTLFRVYSGSIKGDSSVYNATQETNERVGQVFCLQGKKQESVSEISAGDIGVVAKLKVTTTGDSLTDAKGGIIFDPIVFPRPTLSRAMVPKTRADEEKISNALHRLAEEDPTLKIERDTQTHELLVSGMGSTHLDVTIERLKRRFGVEVDVKPPKVPYLETIRSSTKVQGKHKKQSGGRGQYGDCWLEISPLPKGKGFEFENRIVGGAIPKGYIPAVQKGVVEAMANGVVAKCPMVDVKVAVYDGSYHDVDSSEMAFKIAGSMGFKKGVLDCRPTLLEPVMMIEVVVPSDSVGDVIGDLNSKRGKILGVEANDDNQNIKAHVPMSSILEYSQELTSMTSGRGIFMMEFDHYDDVPEHLAAKIIAEKNAEK